MQLNEKKAKMGLYKTVFGPTAFYNYETCEQILTKKTVEIRKKNH